MFSPPIPMLFPVFWAHLRKIEFLYSMQTWKELCDKLAISWLKLAKTWANWRLSYHMQGFQQPTRRRIPFPQTLSSFPSNVLILSLKCSPTFRLCRYSVGNYRTSPAASVPPLNIGRTVPNLRLNPHLEKYLLGIKKKDIRWGSGYLSEVRCLADSNRRRRFCRPVTKPLIQGTIH